MESIEYNKRRTEQKRWMSILPGIYPSVQAASIRPNTTNNQTMPPKKPKIKAAKVLKGAVPPRTLERPFPKLQPPIRPPYPPMEAKSVKEIPQDDGWQYEPKWDGFRCLAFRDLDQIVLQSKSGQPLDRYFPELVASLRALPDEKFVLDGEIIVEHDGVLHFDELLQRIHPAASRIRRLAQETPATLVVFDLLVMPEGKPIVALPLAERRTKLERFFADLPKSPHLSLSPATKNLLQAEIWYRDWAVRGCDGVVAKRLDVPYLSGERTAMVKIKRLRTADVVVGGFRYAQKGGAVGSLLLGLYNDQGLLDHVGFSSSFSAAERKKLKTVLQPFIQPKNEAAAGFTGNAPGGPSRWATERSTEWVPLKSELVCEVQYDHFSGGRFRHGTKFLRWRPDKDPRTCTFDQLEVKSSASSMQRSA
ncbi:MAG TPA: ATP-dependent DNA ligase [Terriglobales bacterium]|nr:ATP-dependent DNA ligase [Terriglobales bacterium]